MIKPRIKPANRHRFLLGLFLGLMLFFPAMIFGETVEITVFTKIEHVAEASVDAGERAAAEGKTPAVVLIEPLHSDAAPNTDVATIEREIELPGNLTVDLKMGKTWRITLRAAGYWSEPKLIAAVSAQDVRLTAWPTAVIQGIFTVERGENPPTELFARFEPSPDSEVFGKITQSSVPCSLNEEHWECRLPAMRADVRLRSPGFISRYFWAYPLRADMQHQFGNLQLQRGAAIAGQVVTQEGGPLPKDCTVRIAPADEGFDLSPEDKRRLGNLTMQLTPDERGFFHFTEVQPGSYMVTAESPGHAPTRLSPVAVMADAETTLTRPLVLNPPLTLEVVITPALDVAKKPWEIELFQLGQGPNGVKSLAQGVISDEGRLVKKDLAPGRYAVRVMSSGGDALAMEEFDLSADSQLIEIELPLAIVEGTIRFDGEPLVAELIFGGRFGEKRITLASDFEGEFYGYLPNDGPWPLYIRAEGADLQIVRNMEVEVEAVDGIAKVEIELPGTRLSGRVVDLQGAPHSPALVSVFEPTLRQKAGVITEPDGTFHFEGLPEGKIILDATGKAGNSGELIVDLTAKLDPSPELVLKPNRHLNGVVLGPTGRLPGVRVGYMGYQNTSAAPYGALAPVSTNIDGEAALEIDGIADRIQLYAMAPGYALKLTEVMEIPAEPFTLRLDPAAGNLIFEVEEEFNADDPWSPRASLWIDGNFFTWELLAQWARIHNVLISNSKEVLLPALPPGRVQTCWLAPDPEDYFAPPKPELGSCQEGFLSPGGELNLRFF